MEFLMVDLLILKFSLWDQKPKGETLLRLGTHELVNCILRTKLKAPQATFLDPDSTGATGIYGEVYSMKGSIVAESSLDEDNMRNLSLNLNTTLTCTQAGGYCCNLKVRVPKDYHVAVTIPLMVQFEVRLYDTRWNRRVFESINELTNTALFIGVSNMVNITLILTPKEKGTDSRFILRFHALRETGLQVKRTARNKEQSHVNFRSVNGSTDDIDLMGGSISDLQDLTNRLVDTAGVYGMEISTEKSKVIKDS